MKLAPLAALSLTLSCGGGDFDPQDGTCSLSVSATPSQPNVGDEVSLSAIEDADPDVFGEREFLWSVTYNDSPVQVSAVATTQDAVFTPSAAGVYEVTLTGSIGGTSCNAGQRSLNALDVGTEFENLTLRIVAAGNQDDRIAISAPLGVDYDLGVLSVPGAAMTSGAIVGPDGGVRAYIELIDGQGRSLYAFSGDDGSFALPLSSGSYDLLISPEDPGLAPTRSSGLSTSTLGGEHTVAAGELVQGVVRDSEGAPVADASVSLRVEGAPPSAATTAADGTFAVRVAAAGQAVLEITPGWDSPLPSGTTSVPVSPAGSLEVDYPALITRSLAATVTADAAPVPGARVWLRSTIAELADIKSGAFQGQAALSYRSTVVADGSGDVSASLPAGTYYAVLETEGRIAGALTLNLTGGDGPSELAWPEPATVSGVVVTEGGDPIAGAVVSAVPQAPLASISGARGQSVTDADGTFSLQLVADSGYRLEFGGVEDRERRSLVLGSGAAGSSTTDLEIVLAPGTNLSGAIERAGAGPVAAAHVAVFDPTADPKIDPPLAATTTDALGEFSLPMASEAE